MNALTAVQYATIRLSEAFDGWKPLEEALADLVEEALDGDTILKIPVAQLITGLAAGGRLSGLGARGPELVSRAQRLDQ